MTSVGNRICHAIFKGDQMTEPITVYIIRLLTALLVGGVVGLEREFKGKPAGIRTNILICVGSCLFMIISIEVARTAAGLADPGRIAAQVVTGVGFLCAGTIMRSRFTISGLTTAATIWVLSALGVAIGAGYTLLAVAGASIITLTLFAVRFLESGIHHFHANHIIQLVMDNRDGMIPTMLGEFSKMKITTEIYDVNLTAGTWHVIIEYNTSKKTHLALLKELSGLDGVSSVTELGHEF
jgi:putative Mg2+ transporter-C (MgtC) family protein